jgi:hypothetical protein
MEAHVPAWLIAMKAYVKCGTSDVSWWRYENGYALPNALCLIATADMYGAQTARLAFLERLVAALLRDCSGFETGKNQTIDTATPEAGVPRTHATRRTAKSASLSPVLFPHFGSALGAARRHRDLTLSEIRHSFPSSMDVALASISENPPTGFVCPSTLWRYEHGLAIPNAVVFALIIRAYDLTLSDLVGALEADVALVSRIALPLQSGAQP